MIVDIDFVRLTEDITPTWGIWIAIATLEDGSRIEGTIQGDGIDWAEETFEPDAE